MSDQIKITKVVAVKNSFWKLLESFLSKGVSMLVSIVLARILLPDDYGIIAFTGVFIQLSDILIQAGFSTVLIRKEKIDKDDYSTVLGISIISAVVIYTVIFLCAPFVAAFYKIPLLTAVLRVISLSLFFQAFVSVRTAIVSREMKFRTLFICSLISNTISGVIGIVWALMGWGVWALVVQQLAQQLFLTVALFITVHMNVGFKISWKSAKEIVPFSMKVLISSLLSFVGNTFYNLAIGKVYTMKDLGYYEKGSLFPQNISLYTFSAVSNVFLPVFSSLRKDYEKLNEVFQRVLNISCYVIFPMMAGLCMTAESLISVLLTDKWLPSAGIMRWSCLYYALTPILLAHVQLHFAIGKSETRIKVEAERIIVMILALVVLILTKSSITTISCAMALIQLFVVVVITGKSVKAIGFDVRLMVKHLLPTVLSTAVMSAAVFLVGKIPLSNFPLLFLQMVVGIGTYWISSIIFRCSAYTEVIGMLKSLIASRK